MTSDPLHTRLCEEYGSEYPIVAFAHTRDVIAAASNAGGIGVLGCSTHTIEEMRADIKWIKERVGDRPYGVDITIPSSYVRGNQEELEDQVPQGHRDWVEQLMRDNQIADPKGPPPEDVRLRGLRDTRTKLEIMMEERIPIFASGLGSPAFILDEMHEAGVKVWGLIGLARQARRELEAGLDLLIAQGQDSAGHTGRIGTFSIVPEVVELAREFDTPILAAGGVTTGRHIVAAITLGAVGVWTGTMWQATHESATGDVGEAEAAERERAGCLGLDGGRRQALARRAQPLPRGVGVGRGSSAPADAAAGPAQQQAAPVDRRARAARLAGVAAGQGRRLRARDQAGPPGHPRPGRGGLRRRGCDAARSGVAAAGSP